VFQVACCWARWAACSAALRKLGCALGQAGGVSRLTGMALGFEIEDVQNMIVTVSNAKLVVCQTRVLP